MTTNRYRLAGLGRRPAGVGGRPDEAPRPSPGERRARLDHVIEARFRELHEAILGEPIPHHLLGKLR